MSWCVSGMRARVSALKLGLDAIPSTQHSPNPRRLWDPLFSTFQFKAFAIPRNLRKGHGAGTPPASGPATGGQANSW